LPAHPIRPPPNTSEDPPGLPCTNTHTLESGCTVLGPNHPSVTAPRCSMFDPKYVTFLTYFGWPSRAQVRPPSGVLVLRGKRAPVFPVRSKNTRGAGFIFTLPPYPPTGGFGGCVARPIDNRAPDHSTRSITGHTVFVNERHGCPNCRVGCRRTWCQVHPCRPQRRP